jgi:NADPH:quinone reductase
VQFGHYGPAGVLRVVDVPRPSAGDGQVLVRVAAAGINPGEIAIRNGAMEQMAPLYSRPARAATSQAGSPSLARASPSSRRATRSWAGPTAGQRKADYVVSDRQHLTAKPPALDWIRAGARVLGIASAANAGRLRAIGVEPVAYGEGLANRLRSLAPTVSTLSSTPTATAT